MAKGSQMQMVMVSVTIVSLAAAGDIIMETRVGTKREEAVDILNKRYARGELTREEYVKMKEELLK